MTPFAMAIAQKVAEKLPDEDSSLSLLSIINPFNPDQKKSRRTAARIFYSMLVLQ